VATQTKNKILIKFSSKLSKLAEINKEACQGCPLLLTLFNIYLDEIITKWQIEDISGIPFSKNQLLLMLLFADDHVITSRTKDNLQRAAHK
jgi:hypothetical protein